MTEQVQRKPIEILAQPSDIEGYTTDIYVNDYRRFTVNLDTIDERGILEIVSGAMQLGAELLLEDSGKIINDVSAEEN